MLHHNLIIVDISRQSNKSCIYSSLLGIFNLEGNINSTDEKWKFNIIFELFGGNVISVKKNNHMDKF